MQPTPFFISHPELDGWQRTDTSGLRYKQMPGDQAPAINLAEPLAPGAYHLVRNWGMHVMRTVGKRTAIYIFDLYKIERLHQTVAEMNETYEGASCSAYSVPDAYLIEHGTAIECRASLIVTDKHLCLHFWKKGGIAHIDESLPV